FNLFFFFLLSFFLLIFPGPGPAGPGPPPRQEGRSGARSGTGPSGGRMEHRGLDHPSVTVHLDAHLIAY
ncbi:hypothetical protein ACFCX4_20040, partial [Kitasatospora sp. NPDC056327]|uniref:hypothetical protein n=1 Tax=Kitasatospora sp. NPDC056327 TaxID=3345785 RepID=UPI0035DD3C5D